MNPVKNNMADDTELPRLNNQKLVYVFASAKRMKEPKRRSISLPQLADARIYEDKAHRRKGHVHHKCSCGLPNPKYCMLDLMEVMEKIKRQQVKNTVWVPMSVCTT